MVQRHRHIVAVPPILLLLVVSLWGGVRGVDLTGAIVAPDGVIFGGEGLKRTSIGESVVSSWSGFFFAKESDGNLSVAAISSPVFIKTASDAVLMPIGWQWRTDEDLSRIPRHFLAQYLTDVVSYSSVKIPTVFETVDAWLVASLHPIMRDQVWVMEDPDGLDESDQAIRLMRFLQSDTLREGAAPFTVERWGIEVREFLEGADDPRIFLNQLVPHVVGMVKWFIEQGYPERASRYREAVEDIASEFRVFLSEESKGILEELHSDKGIILDEEIPNEVTEVNESNEFSVLEPFDPETVKQQIYMFLRDIGALFTINTEIVPASLSSAEVHEIVFGNHIFDFVLDMNGQVLDSISMDGKVMAYPMTVEGFREWVGRL